MPVNMQLRQCTQYYAVRLLSCLHRWIQRSTCRWSVTGVMRSHLIKMSGFLCLIAESCSQMHCIEVLVSSPFVITPVNARACVLSLSFGTRCARNGLYLHPLSGNRFGFAAKDQFMLTYSWTLVWPENEALMSKIMKRVYKKGISPILLRFNRFSYFHGGFDPDPNSCKLWKQLMSQVHVFKTAHICLCVDNAFLYPAKTQRNKVQIVWFSYREWPLSGSGPWAGSCPGFGALQQPSGHYGSILPVDGDGQLSAAWWWPAGHPANLWWDECWISALWVPPCRNITYENVDEHSVIRSFMFIA